jgi:DNA-binding protein HU-beta
MTKAELVERVCCVRGAEHLSKKAAGEVCDALWDEVKKSIKKDRKFGYPGFGTFTVRKRKARTGRNPQTGEKIQIKPSKTVGFKPAPAFKDSL